MEATSKPDLIDQVIDIIFSILKYEVHPNQETMDRIFKIIDQMDAAMKNILLQVLRGLYSEGLKEKEDNDTGKIMKSLIEVIEKKIALW